MSYPSLFTTPGVRHFAEEVDAERQRQLAEFGEQHQHWGQRRWNAWKSARLRAQEAAAARDGAYRERAHLVALLAAMTDGAVIVPAPDVEQPGWQIAYLTIGGHQASWHISPRDACLFECMEHVGADNPRAQWDGHTTEEKYAAIAAHAAALTRRCGPACAEHHTETGRCEIARNR